MPKVNIGDVSLYYVVYRNELETELDPSLPTLIVHHGGMGFLDHQLELEPWRPFSKTLQVIFMDQRGCGRSEDGSEECWSMDQFGDDIKAFSDALGLTHPILGGVSSGGYASIACATRHPGFPRGLILLNTEPVSLPGPRRDAYVAQASRADRREFATFSEMTDEEITAFAEKAGQLAYDYDMRPETTSFSAFAEYGFSTISKNSYELVPPVRVNERMKDKFRNGYGMFDYTEKMALIQCPVIWFAGAYDPIHPYAGAEAAAKLVPNCELHVLDAAGVPVYCDAGELFYQLVGKFFERLKI